jgi:xylose dehydrogenase (NAD/NADP)
MKVKWAVWGSGGIARRRTIPEGILKASNAELAAVYDVDIRANREIAQMYNVKACSTEQDLLATACDAVYVATPACLHCEQVIRAADVGKHILCEKPLGMTVEEGQRMIDAC